MIRKIQRKDGFTFLEIMFVVVIIGILLSLATPNLFKWVNQAKVQTTKANMKTIQLALAGYELNVGNCPDTVQGLEALVECPADIDENSWGDEPYFDDGAVPKDGWKNDYLYMSPGDHLPKYDLWSKGKDQKDGTTDDIHNWMEQAEEEL
ncbi:type II secretion system major pseudopilin GspG [Candidatus Sumerlaeota bacterium]|nr:type II secretion system major pseudopilin GspG [Candidatus Sumerlaeota bacterium]